MTIFMRSCNARFFLVHPTDKALQVLGFGASHVDWMVKVGPTRFQQLNPTPRSFGNAIQYAPEILPQDATGEAAANQGTTRS